MLPFASVIFVSLASILNEHVTDELFKKFQKQWVEEKDVNRLNHWLQSYLLEWQNIKLN